METLLHWQNEPRPGSRLVLGIDSSMPESTDETVHILMRVNSDGTTETLGTVRGHDIPAVSELISANNREADLETRREQFHVMIGDQDMNDYARHLGYGKYAAACGMFSAAETFQPYPGGTPTKGYEGEFCGTHRRKEDNPRVGRNDPCPCGCGRKAKRCANRK